MRVPMVWTVALLLGAVLAGCLDSEDPLVTDDETEETLRPIWFLSAANETVTEQDFGAELPAFDLYKASDRISGEPTLGVTRSGAVFYAAIDFDAVADLPMTYYMRSTDGGESWEAKNPQMAGVETHPTSFDPYVYVDPTTGRVYTMDMGPHVACNKVSWSDDDGETWVTREGACIPGANDHPSLWAGPATAMTNVAIYPNQLYLCTNAVSNIHCYQSPDGGITWLETTPAGIGYDPMRAEVTPDPDPGVVAGGVARGLCGSLHGHGHASWADGTVYLGRSFCGTPTVHVSHDGGLTWETVVISDDPKHDQGGLGWEHDISISTDKDGNAYALWLGDRARSTYLSVSKDQGMTWSEPINVTAPDVTGVKFASLVAGDAGRIAFLYVGTENPYGHQVGRLRDGCIDASKPYCYDDPDTYNNTTWNAYIGISLNADSEEPIFAMTLANAVDEPLKRGACVDRCFGDEGGMYDFLDIEIDPMTGQVWAALVDVCSEGCDGAEYGKFNAHEKAIGIVAKLVSNTTLLEEPIAERAPLVKQDHASLPTSLWWLD